MRIISGEYAGRNLKIPPRHITRPMAERAREALFDALTQKTDRVRGKRALDAFSGSGSLGLEALSHGAEATVFIDKSHHAIDCLRQNIRSLGVDEQTTVLRRDVTRCGRPPHGFRADLFFLSPPWQMTDLYAKSLRRLGEHGWLAPGALGVIDMDIHNQLRLPVRIAETRKCGDHLLTFTEYEGK